MSGISGSWCINFLIYTSFIVDNTLTEDKLGSSSEEDIYVGVISLPLYQTIVCSVFANGLQARWETVTISQFLHHHLPGRFGGLLRHLVHLQNITTSSLLLTLHRVFKQSSII